MAEEGAGCSEEQDYADGVDGEYSPEGNRITKEFRQHSAQKYANAKS